MEHGGTQIAFLAFSKTLPSAVLGQNIYAISCSEIMADGEAWKFKRPNLFKRMTKAIDRVGSFDDSSRTFGRDREIFQHWKTFHFSDQCLIISTSADRDAPAVCLAEGRGALYDAMWSHLQKERKGFSRALERSLIDEEQEWAQNTALGKSNLPWDIGTRGSIDGNTLTA